MAPKRWTRLAKNPRYAFAQVRARMCPANVLRKTLLVSPSLGITGKFLILSLDCDTDDDLEAVSGVCHGLHEIGIKPTIAVPGELLLRNSGAFVALAESGIEFLNHGGRSHAEKTRSGQVESTLFYSQMSEQEIRADVALGEEILAGVLGVKPRGFRTPHFGEFNQPHQLKFLHSLLVTSGYSFSSSTVPFSAFRKGCVYQTKSGLFEFPVVGRASAPLTILDSWSTFGAPRPSLSPEQFCLEVSNLGDCVKSYPSEHGFLLNLYLDPSHIAGRTDVFDSLKSLALSATSVSYEGFLHTLANSSSAG